MINLLDVLIHANDKSAAWSKEVLKQFINSAQGIDFDWDCDGGERWATMEYHNQFVGYLYRDLPLCFVKQKFLAVVKNLFSGFIDIIEEENFDEKRWYLQSNEVANRLNSYYWIIEEGMLHVESFSINDLWYATI